MAGTPSQIGYPRLRPQYRANEAAVVNQLRRHDPGLEERRLS